jgi:hypothetical protein
VEKTIADLVAYVLTYLDREEIPRDLEGRITLFFKYNIEKIGAKVYQYYK